MDTNPCRPSVSDCGWKHEIVEEIDQHVDVNEVPDVVFGSLTQYLLVHASTVVAAREIVRKKGLGPADMKWQVHRSGCLRNSRVTNVIGNGDRSRRGSERCAALTHTKSVGGVRPGVATDERIESSTADANHAVWVRTPLLHGIVRFSQDIDATRHAPALHKLEALDVTRAIRSVFIDRNRQ
jgi:hypothetical protein